MGPRRTSEEVASALGRRLGGTVHDLRRLSGGASRLTSSFDLHPAGGGEPQPLILQQDRGDGVAQGDGVARPSRAEGEAALLQAAGRAGVPVPSVLAVGDGADDGMGTGWLVVQRLEGETIPRKILRDPEWSGARQALTGQCARALAAIHSMEPGSIQGLAPRDPLRDPLPFLDVLGQARPALEFGARWLEANRLPAGRRVTVHGDFRMGNLLVGPDGLRAVLDWELAHAGEAAEDIGWLCAPAWRFGGPDPVGGFGALDELLEAYVAAGGAAIDPVRVRWWQVYATVKWAVICALQASAHLSGATRSVELAAIGRRVCESEWDLCVLLGLPVDRAEADPPPAPEVLAPFGRPTAVELVEAVREYLEVDVMEGSDPSARFTGRVARNALLTVERQLRLGPALAAAHAGRLAGLGFDDDRQLAGAIRAGTLDQAGREVGSVLAAAARDQLLVANPGYLAGAVAGASS